MCAILVVLLVASCASPTPAQPADVPVPIRDLYSGLWEALATEQVEVVKACLSHSLLPAPAGEPVSTSTLGGLVDNYRLTSAEGHFVACTADGDYARVVHDLHLCGENRRTGEEIDVTQRRVDWLDLHDGRWRILRSVEVDRDQEAHLLQDDTLVAPEFGIRLPVPAGWALHLFVGTEPLEAVLLRDDPRVQVLLMAREAEGGDPPDYSSALASRAKVIPGHGGTGEVVNSGPVTLGGVAGYGAESLLSLDGLSVRVLESACAKQYEHSAVCCRLILTADGGDLSGARDDFARMCESLVIGPRAPIELPPEFGTIIDGRYVNLEHQVCIDVPEGWTAGIIHAGRKPFSLAMRDPEGRRRVGLTMFDFGAYLDPRAVARGWQEGLDPWETERISEGPWAKGSAEGYQILSKLTSASGKPYTVWTALVCRGTKLLILHARVCPPEGYESVKHQWAQLGASLKLGPEALEGL